MNYVFIDQEQAWENCISQLVKANAIAIDLEFDKNRFRYGFNLCLMQIYDGSTIYLIDPLSKQVAIDKVFPVLEDQRIQKICFSFGEDIRLLHSLGCFPKNIYDLQFCAALLNFPPSSLATLLFEVLGISLSKASQDSNWFTRPLSDKQLHYAKEDVAHLFELKNSFEESTERISFYEWIKQENEAFAAIHHHNIDHNVILKERYKADMTEYEWHIFSELMQLRNDLAMQINRPPFHISERKTMEFIARNPEKINSWKTNSSNHEYTKSKEVLNKIESVLNDAIEYAELNELSKTKRAANRLSKEEYLEMKATDQKVRFAKEKYFKPIQELLTRDYGEHTKTFILSNRLIKDIVANSGESILPYKKELFLKYSEELNIDISNYLN